MLRFISIKCVPGTECVLLIRLFVVSSSLNFAHFFVWVSNQKSVENFQQGVFVATKDYAVM